MARLAWHKAGAKRYESGVDRGVLYLPDGTGVPWNGLTSVEEDTSDVESTAYHFDGTKYLDTRYPGDFSATLRAFTYPDEFLPFDGFGELNNGVLLGHQPVYDRFGLCYRTLIGNDVDGLEHGYKLHILYNLVATPDTRGYKSLSGQQDMGDFGWKITGVPEAIEGHRPTVHIILDTTRMNPFLIRDVERLLYGTDDVIIPPVTEDTIDGGDTGPPLVNDILNGGSTNSSGIGKADGGPVHRDLTPHPTIIPGLNPQLPALQDLVDLLNSWVLIDVVDNGDGTFSVTGPDELVKWIDDDTFQITSGSAIFLDEDTYELSTTHSF